MKRSQQEKSSPIIVVEEGDKSGDTLIIAKKVKKYALRRAIRISVLGHIQRDRSPTAFAGSWYPDSELRPLKTY